MRSLRADRSSACSTVQPLRTVAPEFTELESTAVSLGDKSFRAGVRFRSADAPINHSCFVRPVDWRGYTR